MSNSTKTIVIGLIFVLFMCVVSYFVGLGKGREIGWDWGYAEGFAVGYATPHPSDTSAVVDTSHYDHPEPVDVKPAPTSDNGRERLLLGTIAELQARLDSLKASKPDTAFVEIPVPVEVKTYADSTYRAQVSGYRPSLDWIEVYQRTQTITNYVPSPVWPTLAISPVLNVEILPRSLFAGAGIVADYWKDRFQLSVEAGYGVNTFLYPVPATDATQATADPSEVVFQKGEVFRGVYGKFTARYNLIRK